MKGKTSKGLSDSLYSINCLNINSQTNARFIESDKKFQCSVYQLMLEKYSVNNSLLILKTIRCFLYGKG